MYKYCRKEINGLSIFPFLINLSLTINLLAQTSCNLIPISDESYAAKLQLHSPGSSLLSCHWHRYGPQRKQKRAEVLHGPERKQKMLEVLHGHGPQRKQKRTEVLHPHLSLICFARYAWRMYRLMRYFIQYKQCLSPCILPWLP